MKNPSLNMANQSDELAISFVPKPIRKLYALNPEKLASDIIADKSAVLLWVDIAHFSTMCNRLVVNKEFGVDRLTSILQEHYYFILGKVNEFGGQPLFFAGDSLMSAWTSDSANAAEMVKSASACALEILKNRQTLDDKGEVLSLHTLVSFGNFEISEFDFVKEKTLASFSGEVFTRLIRTARNRAINQLLISKEALDCLQDPCDFTELEHEGYILHAFHTTSSASLLPEDFYPDATIQKLKSYVPLTLTFPLNKEQLKWIAEIRPVTIVFFTIKNSVQDSKHNLSHIRNALAIILPFVNKYEALINQVWVDEKEFNMLICFGPPPSSHVNNAERGVKLALEAHEMLLENGITTSAGVSTGMAFCGILGNDHLRQYTVIGDVVNLSARLAERPTYPIYCDKTSFQATRSFIQFDEPELVTIKGFSGLVPIYKPISVNSDTSPKSLSQISVGREKEMNILGNGISKILNGETCFFLIEGETGMGKSSLVFDFMNKLFSEKILVLGDTCDFVLRNSPYSAFHSIIKNLISIDSSDLGDNQNDQLQRIQLEFGSKTSLLNIVLNISLPDSEEVRGMSLSQRVSATHDFLLELISKKALSRPLVILIDNAHWIDDSSWKLLNSIQEQSKRVLVLLSFQKTEGILGAQQLIENGGKKIVLEPLSDFAIETLACSKLGVTTISPELSALIKKVSKGNPFFCIEFSDSLVAQELLSFENQYASFHEDVDVDSLSLPESVRSLIRGRIDKLGPGSQLSLKVGSVVGSRFAEKIISSIYPIKHDRKLVSSYLREVEQYGFLNESIVDNLTGYQFNNDATVDVAYEMTLLEQRRQLHRESAEWYEKSFKNNLFPFYRRLANHWYEANEKEKSAYYYEQEAMRLFQLGYAKEALDVGLKGLEMLGLEIPRELPVIQQQLSENFGAIMQTMAGRSIDGLADHKKMEDKRMAQLISSQLMLNPIAHQCQQGELFALFSIICQKLTLENGNSDAAAEVYAMFSIIYKVFTGDSEGAYQWSNLSIEVDKRNNYSYQSRVLFIHCWFIALWKKPLQTLIPIADEGADAGFRLGDIVYGCFNLSLSVVLKCVSGSPLKEVKETAQVYYLRNNQTVLNAAFHLVMEEQMAKALEGNTNEPTSLTDEKYDEARDIATICQTDLYNQIAYYFIGKLKLAIHYSHWAEAVDWGNKTLPLLPAFVNQPGQIELEQYHTIAFLYRAQETLGEERNTLQECADAGIEKLKNWATICPENFSHKALLAEAIRDALQGKDSAQDSFISAANTSRKNGFLQDCGLAYEHLARSQKDRGLKTKQAIDNAISAYTEWGAMAKVSYLKKVFGI